MGTRFLRLGVFLAVSWTGVVWCTVAAVQAL